ncbi:hypothetical protein MRX96_001351 [Rhipicephalus microplus]
MCSPGFVTVSQAGHQSGPVAPQCAHAQKTFQSGAPRGPDSGRRVTAAERVPTGRRTSAVCEGVTARPCGGIEQPGDPAENCGSLSRIRKRKTKAFDREEGGGTCRAEMGQNGCRTGRPRGGADHAGDQEQSPRSRPAPSEIRTGHRAEFNELHTAPVLPDTTAGSQKESRT